VLAYSAKRIDELEQEGAIRCGGEAAKEWSGEP